MILSAKLLPSCFVIVAAKLRFCYVTTMKRYNNSIVFCRKVLAVSWKMLTFAPG